MSTMHDENTIIEDATKSWTKEDHIAYLMKRVDIRQSRMEEMAESIKKMQTMNHRDLVRVEELRLLRDIRDGKVSLVHAETGRPFNVHVFKP